VVLLLVLPSAILACFLKISVWLLVFSLLILLSVKLLVCVTMALLLLHFLPKPAVADVE
jgi:hypothetical protein